MDARDQVVNIARLRLRVGIDEFLKVVDECVEYTNREPGVLAYDWYLNRAEGTCDIIAVFESVDALNSHGGGEFGRTLLPKLFDVAERTSSDTYGELNEASGFLNKAGRKVHGAPTIVAGAHRPR